MTREQLNQICNTIRTMKKASDKLSSVKAGIEALRDEAKLATTKALYQAILDLFEEDA